MLAKTALPSAPRCLCPYLDRRDSRCAAMLTLTRLAEAFRLCAGDHECCSVYHQIRWGDLQVAGEPDACGARRRAG